MALNLNMYSESNRCNGKPNQESRRASIPEEKYKAVEETALFPSFIFFCLIAELMAETRAAKKNLDS